VGIITNHPLHPLQQEVLMMQIFLDRLGDWNPQFLREIKGRIQSRNILLVIAISLLSQFILWMFFQTQLPIAIDKIEYLTNKYCTGNRLRPYPDALPKMQQCLQDGYGNLIINWELWFQDVFTWLSIIGCFSLLVAGTYLLISDLAHEERQDTLNFIRLSPQSSQSILLGKMLGVPILLYLTVFVAIPLHLWIGLSAQVPLWQIFGFYAVVLFAGFFYYSAALLFGLVGSWLGGFQSWLGAGLVLGFLMLTKEAFVNDNTSYSLIYLRFFNPFYFIPRLSSSSIFGNVDSWNDVKFFVPVQISFAIAVGLALFNYGILARFTWLSLQRCFRDSNATMLSKKQSYLLTSYFSITTLGFANWQQLLSTKSDYHRSIVDANIFCLLFLHFGLFLYLIAAVSPHRQSLQDWARYRRMSNKKIVWNQPLIKDLLWSENSPGILAIALNAIIAILIISVLVLAANTEFSQKIKYFVALGFCGTLAIMYAALAQLVLFMKNRHRVFFANGAVIAAIVLPLIIPVILLQNPANQTYWWMFSIYAPVIPLFQASSLDGITAFLSILSQLSITTLLMFQMTKQLKKAGESSTKALLAEQVK
jgi:hypothetical protein